MPAHPHINDTSGQDMQLLSVLSPGQHALGCSMVMLLTQIGKQLLSTSQQAWPVLIRP